LFNGLAKRPFQAIVVTTFFSFLPSVLFVAAENNHGTQIGGDGTWYLNTAGALAAGKGYLEGWFLSRPTAWRPPLWAFLESIVMRSGLFSQPLSSAHAALLIVHGTTILGVTILTWKISRSIGPMLCAGLSVGLWPGALSAILWGGSEPCSGAVLALGTVLICQRKLFWWGVLTLSAMPLVRPNFLVLPPCVAIILLMRSRTLHANTFMNPARLLVAALIFYLPSAAWIARNYRTMGAFPLFATQNGDTLYGCYNPVSATMGSQFATWIGPRHVLSEEDKPRVFAVSEVESDRYLRELGMRFIRAHWRIVPAMILGHLAWALLPSHDSVVRLLVYPEWICRLGLYAAVLLALTVRNPPSLPPGYKLLLGATTLTIAATTIVFFFDQRYLYPLSVLLIPFAVSSQPFLRSTNSLPIGSGGRQLRGWRLRPGTVSSACGSGDETAPEIQRRQGW
jgi:hypothetical protein